MSYADLWSEPQGEAVRALAAEVGEQPDTATLRSALVAGGLARIVAAARAEIDADEAREDELLGCDVPRPEPACGLRRRYLFPVSRLAEPQLVFANLLLGLELARADPRYVGVNLAAPEDHPIALRDYTLQMQIVGELRGLYPDVHVTLHAGEIVPGMVAPGDLRSHIREAVEVAGAERIGHGVGILAETDPASLLETMARRHVLVEAPLKTNEHILGVRGAAHPFRHYLAAGVPVAPATDDAGISRSDLTHEYELATARYELSYTELRRLSRTSLEYAFLPGDSLWAAPGEHRRRGACAHDVPGRERLSRTCRTLLRSSAKAAAQWDLEGRLRAFERRVATAGGPVRAEGEPPAGSPS